MPIGRARAQREVRVKVVGVVVQPVGKSNRITRVKFLDEPPHNLLQAGLQNVIGVNPHGHQRIMLFFRHGEDQPMRDDRTARL